jgi:hypothetical protein
MCEVTNKGFKETASMDSSNCNPEEAIKSWREKFKRILSELRMIKEPKMRLLVENLLIEIAALPLDPSPHEVAKILAKIGLLMREFRKGNSGGC